MLRVYVVWAVFFSLLLFAKGAFEHLADKQPRPVPQLIASAAETYARDLKRYSFGFDSLIAAFHWIDLLQRARHQHAGVDTVSWEYVQLDAITRLDPLFERAYAFGGVVLSVLVQDKWGALRILEKWSRRNPRAWRVHYLLGYHLFFEMKDYQSASKHILKAAELDGSPSWLASLAVRLLSQTGALAESLRLCIELYDQIPDVEGKDRLSLRIRSLNFKLQKHAWETALDRFRTKFGRDPTRSVELAPWVNSPVREIATSIGGKGVVMELAVLLTERFAFRYDSVKRQIIADLPSGSIGPDEVGIYQSN